MPTIAKELCSLAAQGAPGSPKHDTRNNFQLDTTNRSRKVAGTKLAVRSLAMVDAHAKGRAEKSPHRRKI
jgi:hypothetical protein